MGANRVIGVDLGGTKIAAGLVDRSGKVESLCEVPTPISSEEAVVGAIGDAIAGLVSDEVAAIGLGVPSTIDQASGTAVSSVNIPLTDVPLRKVIGDRFGLPCGIDNDANAAAIGEWHAGAGKGTLDMIMLTLGTGVGGGLILDGRPYRGALGAAAELGHIVIEHDGRPCQGNCTGRGHLEAYATGLAAAADAQAVFGPDADARTLLDRAHEGDEQALDILHRMGRRLGSALRLPREHLQPGADRRRRGVGRGRRRIPARPGARGDAARGAVARPRARPGRPGDAWFGRRRSRRGVRRVRGARQAIAMALAVCATPIGNLDDVTLRVLDELRAADVVLCEDTRVTRVLLDRHGIKAKLLSYHEHNEAKRTAELVPRLAAGERMALVTDAGLPGVSDPGARLVAAALDAGVPVTVLPGPSAVDTALVAAGLGAERFQFIGFLPRYENALRELWAELARWPHAVVAFESAQRLPRSLRSLAEAMPDRRVAVARELTKFYEEVARGTATELAERFAEPPKGEIVLVLGPTELMVTPEGEDEATSAVAELVAAGLPRRRAAEVVSRLTGVSRNTLYDRSL